MSITRGEIAQRCLLLRCPNCGEGALLGSWFRLRSPCPHCGLTHGKEDGFTLGTTSIGYVVAFVIVVVPVGALVLFNKISVWVGVVVGIGGSLFLSIALFPLFLGWVVLTYYLSKPDELPGNKPTEKK